MKKETKPTTIIELDKIDPMTLPELASFKEKSLAVVKENPYVEIVDNPTYELAKKARTNLRSTRTELQKQEKAIKDKLNGFKKRVENVTAELIAISEPHEIKQQTEVTRYEDIKEQERLEKQRIEQERVDSIKNRIKSFADLFNSKIESLTFAGIDYFKAEFYEFVNIQNKSSFEEFEVLYDDMLQSVSAHFKSKQSILIEQEQNRLEQIRLTEEREKQLAESKRIAQEMEDARQKFLQEQKEAEEKLVKEKAEFDIKRLDIRFNLVRKKELAEIGLLEEGTDFKHHLLGKLTSFEYIRNCTEEDFDKFLANTKYAILKEEKANEPVVVEDEDIDFNKLYEDAIENLNELTDDSETMEVDFEETWDYIHDQFLEFTEIDDSINFYYWLKDNFEVPKRLIK